MKLDLTSFKKALLSLEKSVKLSQRKIKDPNIPQDEIDTIKAGVIQNFEFTYELSWKFIQHWLKENYSAEESEHPVTRKELFRQAAAAFLICDPLPWFEYSEKRNLTSHTYDEDTAETVYQTAIKFLPDSQYLYKQLEANND